jgi:hypothetical protein
MLRQDRREGSCAEIMSDCENDFAYSEGGAEIAKFRKDKRIDERNALNRSIDFSLREVGMRRLNGKSFALCMYEHTYSPITQSEGPIHDS